MDRVPGPGPGPGPDPAFFDGPGPGSGPGFLKVKTGSGRVQFIHAYLTILIILNIFDR